MSVGPRSRRALLTALVLTLAVAPVVGGHGVDEGDKAFLEGTTGARPGAFVYLGAEHMVTGYDHILFLVGVIFFLYKMEDVLHYVSMFTIGHSVTLVAGVLLDVTVSAFLIDAVIGLSVAYKGFDNLDGFETVLGYQPNTKAAVLIFGLFHGWGLATKLQALSLSEDDLLVNILSFNLGVEIGQFLALGGILLFMVWWRSRDSFQKGAFATNAALMGAGFVLFGYQMTGFLVGAG